MDKMNLSVCLREMARSQKTPLCDEWYKEWNDETDIDELLDKYVRGFDFIVKNDFPPLDFGRKMFNKEDLHKHNIFLDENVDIKAGNGCYIFLGDCTGRIIAEDTKAVVVYLRHNSKVDVKSTYGSRVSVFYYDSSSGKAEEGVLGHIKTYDRRKK